MIRKTFIETDSRLVARVTFTLPNSIWANAIYLVGDFNDWNRTSHPFPQDRDGHWSITVDLELGRAFQFRYLRDGEEWMNDLWRNSAATEPTRTCPIPTAATTFVVTDPNFEPYYD
jgi:1,4-alpha-glucan branching enzyme